MLSYWERKFWNKPVDFTIIGAGIVGLFSAYFLKVENPNATVAVIEKGLGPSGASTKNAGFACYGTAGEILDDLESMPKDVVMETVKLRWKGLQLLQKTVSPKALTMSKLGGYEVFRTEDAFESCYSQLSDINDLLEAATGVSETLEIKERPLGRLYHKTLFNSLEAQLNPMHLCHEMVRLCREIGVRFYFGLEINNLSDDSNKVHLESEALSLYSHQVILATNAFTPVLRQDLDIVPVRNQVLLSSPIPNLSVKGTFHLDRGYIYFRNVDDRLLIGGARHILATEEEKTMALGSNPIIIDYLKQLAVNELGLKNFTVAHKWSGIIATGATKQPIIRAVSPHLVCAVRLGGMGVATGSAVAREVVNIITGTSHKTYDEC